MNNKKTLWGLDIPQGRKYLIDFLFVVFALLVISIFIFMVSSQYLPMRLHPSEHNLRSVLISLYGSDVIWNYIEDYPTLLRCYSSFSNMFFAHKPFYITVLLLLLLSITLFVFILRLTSEKSILKCIEEYELKECQEQKIRAELQHEKEMVNRSFEQGIAALESKYGKANPIICIIDVIFINLLNILVTESWKLFYCFQRYFSFVSSE